MGKPECFKDNLLTFLRREKDAKFKGGIYHKIQLDFTYNSNHIEGSSLTQKSKSCSNFYNR